MIKILFIIVVLSGTGLAYYYEFENTLMLSEIVGNTDDPMLDVLISTMDFDTGLTRYDLHRLAKKAPEWNGRMDQINRNPDPSTRQREADALMAEMMRDPAMKKILVKLAGFGAAAAKAILQAAMDFKSFGLF